MRSLMFVLSALGVMGLAFWAYQENYATQQALRHVEGLQKEIGVLREDLGMMRAEWAYLNRPNRLRELADINFDRLGLLPLASRQFGRVDQIAFPSDPLAPIENAVDVVGIIGETQ